MSLNPYECERPRGVHNNTLRLCTWPIRFLVATDHQENETPSQVKAYSPNDTQAKCTEQSEVSQMI